MTPSRLGAEQPKDQRIRWLWLMAILKSCEHLSVRSPTGDRNEERDLLKIVYANVTTPRQSGRVACYAKPTLRRPCERALASSPRTSASAHPCASASCHSP
jgi:hypothetical protein